MVLGRFVGKAQVSLRLVKMAAQSKEEIVAITGATYTSKAIVDAVNMCLANYRKIIEDNRIVDENKVRALQFLALLLVLMLVAASCSAPAENGSEAQEQPSSQEGRK